MRIYFCTKFMTFIWIIIVFVMPLSCLFSFSWAIIIIIVVTQLVQILKVILGVQQILYVIIVLIYSS